MPFLRRVRSDERLLVLRAPRSYGYGFGRGEGVGHGAPCCRGQTAAERRCAEGHGHRREMHCQLQWWFVKLCDCCIVEVEDVACWA